METVMLQNKNADKKDHDSQRAATGSWWSSMGEITKTCFFRKDQQDAPKHNHFCVSHFTSGCGPTISTNSQEQSSSNY